MQKQEYSNLSDGVTDGIVLFYMKNGKLHPIGLTKDQAAMLDLIITTPFSGTKLMVSPNPLQYSAIKHMIDK